MEDKRKEYEEKMKVIREIEEDKRRQEEQEREEREEMQRESSIEVKAMATQFKAEKE